MKSILTAASFTCILMTIVLARPLYSAEEFRTYGEKNGYDPQLLQNYLNLSDHRVLLDLNGEWTVAAGGINRRIIVPSSYDYAGKVTYKRSFTPGPEFKDKHFRLTSFGINFRADIRINGEFITNTNNSYMRLETDLREDLIHVGETNTIEITVDSELEAASGFPRRTPMLQPKSYGGIFREIFLVGIPKIAVEKYFVSYAVSADLRKCDFLISMNFRNFEYSLRLTDSLALTKTRDPFRYIVELFDENEPEPVYTNRFKKYRNTWDIPKIREQNAEDTVTVRNFATRELHFSIDKPVFWNPITPSRYRAVVYLVRGNDIVDRVEFQVGIAQADVHDQYIFLNSQPITVRGVEYYEDYPGSGNTVSYAVMEQDVLKIKRLGANTVYFRHHQPHPYFLELCNRYGLLVMYEIPAWGLTSNIQGSPAFMEDLKKYARNTVQMDYLNPCILAWGIAYAPDNSDREAHYYFSQMTTFLKNLDGRPLFATSIFGGYDSFMDNVDIIALDLKNNNILSSNLFVNRSLSKWPGRALLAIYGAQIFSNNQNGYSDPMSTKFQAKWLVDVQKKLPEWKLAGGIVRSYNDFVTNRSYVYANPNSDASIFTSGLVTFDRQDRFSFEVARALYSDDAMEPIAVGSFERVYPKTYPIVGLILVLIFVSFYRQSGRFKNCSHRAIGKLLSFFADVRENRVITLWPALLAAFICSLSYVMLWSIVFFELRRNQLFDETIGLLLPWPSVKSWMDGLAWSPEAFIAQGTLIYLTVFGVLAVVLKGCARVFNSPISFQQTLIASLWSGAHMMFLIPFVIIFHRWMYLDIILSTSVVLVVGMFIWHWIRFIKIARVIYDASWWRVGAIFGSLMILLFFFAGWYYAGHFDTFNLISYLDKISQSRNYAVE